jgi:hypothetical protein
VLRRNAIATVRRRGKGLRPEQMVDVEREWRNLPETGRLAPLVVTKERHHFSLADLRAIPERLTRPAAWNEDGNEPAIMLTIYSLRIDKQDDESGDGSC